MEADHSNRKLVCVLFPGIVKNEEKALHCLGGNKTVSDVYSNIHKKRLGVSLMPENPFQSQIYADVSKTTGVLIKVRVRKSRSGNTVKQEVLSTNVVGRVLTIFKYEGMGDFQYLPVHNELNKNPQCLIDPIFPRSMADSGIIMNPPVTYLIPTMFTRSDRPFDYKYLTRRTTTKDGPPAKQFYKPPTPTFVTFNLTSEFPTQQKKEQLTIEELREKFCQEELDRIKELFEERPMWTLNALRFRCTTKKNDLRFMLPTFAYYFTSGPWKMCWAKYGYDPRRDPQARLYQVFDFRVKGELSSKVNMFSHQNRRADRVWAPKKQELVSESQVIFRPGCELEQRQIYYHYCDILIPEVQEPLSVEPAPGMLCHAATGWLPPGFDQLCRAHVYSYSNATLIASNVAVTKQEYQSSDEDKNSDDEDDASSSAEV